MAAPLVADMVRRSMARAIAEHCTTPSHSHPCGSTVIGEIFTDDLSEEEHSDDGDEDEPLRTAPPSAHGPMLRNSSRGNHPCVAAWHDVIASAEHRAALFNDADSIVGETFWIDDHEEPRCSLERFALDVLHFHRARAAPHHAAQLHGVEWWVQVRRSDGTPTIRLHWDSDEEHKATSGEHVPPWLGTVTYLGNHGAPTVVFPVAADAHGRATRCRDGIGAFVSTPREGKHLAFDGRLLHGALHELAAAHEEEYVRVSLLVNLWIGHKPDAHRLPAATAATLSNLGAVARFDSARPAEMIERPHGIAGLVAMREGAGAGGGGGGGGDLGWHKLKVGFTPLRELCARQPGWRKLAIGFPFFHPDVCMQGLPFGWATPNPPSLVRVESLRMRLPFESAGERSGAEEQPQIVPAGEQLLNAAVAELAESGDWRARRFMRCLVPCLRARLPEVREDGVGKGFDAGVAALPRIGGEPPLLYLAREGLGACALCLLGGRHPSGPFADHAALDVNGDDADGFTALHYAANLGLADLVPTLLECGASVSMPTRDVTSLREPGGRTPLHLAASAGQAAIARALLAAGADPRAEDWQEATPALLAFRRGHTRLAALIQRHGDGEADGMPTEDELRGFELAESICMRERTRLRLSLDGRDLLQTPFVLPAVLPPGQCVEIIAAAERAATLRGWQSTRHRHYPTVDMPIYDLPTREYEALRALLVERLLPTMRHKYAARPLRVREAFVVKYEAAAQGGQPGLDFHRDGTLLNCILLLSNPEEDFEGGGTVFAPPLDATYKVGQGDCLGSSGQLLHGARAVTRGKRYVMIAFIDELQEEALT